MHDCGQHFDPTVAEDYENVITLLEFVAGLQRQCLNVVTTSDNVPESVETFRVVISETSDSRVEITTPTSAVIEILDDDGETMTDISILHFSNPLCLPILKTVKTHVHVDI